MGLTHALSVVQKLEIVNLSEVENVLFLQQNQSGAHCMETVPISESPLWEVPLYTCRVLKLDPVLKKAGCINIYTVGSRSITNAA